MTEPPAMAMLVAAIKALLEVVQCLISHTTMMGSMHRINSRLLPGLLESYM
jgi:hypothetical protein